MTSWVKIWGKWSKIFSAKIWKNFSRGSLKMSLKGHVQKYAFLGVFPIFFYIVIPKLILPLKKPKWCFSEAPHLSAYNQCSENMEPPKNFWEIKLYVGGCDRLNINKPGIWALNLRWKVTIIVKNCNIINFLCNKNFGQ